MAGMFYSLQEVVEKLGKTEQEVKDFVKQGRLREFRDGPNLLFKIDEVEALLSDTKIMASAKDTSGIAEEEIVEEEISLVPDETPAVESELADADTAVAGEGVNILDEMEQEYKLADDTKGETKVVSEEASLEEIEGDVNLDSFGSGSGLLDLSLQADDTSLGGILDEIYTSEGDEGKAAAGAPGPGSARDVAAEAEQMLSAEETFAAPQSAVEAVIAASAYAESQPDTSSNALGMLLFLPMLVVIYTTIVAVAAFSYRLPSILKQLQGVILYVLAALFIAALIYGIAFMVVGGGAKAAKKPKAKKQQKAAEEELPPAAPPVGR